MRRKSAVALFVVIGLSGACFGCGPRTIKLDTAFNPDDAAIIHKKGKGAINGQAFLRRNDGIVVYAAGSNVALTPVTLYSEERVSKGFGGSKYLSGIAASVKFEGDDPRYNEYKRVTKANGEGRFKFESVAPGSYFVVTGVEWCVPSQYGCMRQGGALMERVSIAGSETAEIILDGN